MALHGAIEVNEQEIGWWVAVRIVTGDPNIYKCQVIADGGPLASFELEHRYEDGAVALAAKVLTRALVKEEKNAKQ